MYADIYTYIHIYINAYITHLDIYYIGVLRGGGKGALPPPPKIG